ncbi:MAG: TetR/AcrR family transcriptional regulator [Solirubrobacteraceae bacterium]|nr:TetR/AcrR family transcriptional regulator [Solirubrobacteraceae bacterium]
MSAPDDVRRRPGGRSARVRSAVLQATMEQLLASGYEELSIGEIADAAGVHRTTIYRRWANKPELVLAAIKEISAAMITVPDTGTVTGDLRQMAGDIATALSAPEVTRFLRSMVALSDDAAAEYRHGFWEDRRERTGVIIDRAVARGELPVDVDGSAVLELVIAPIWFRLLVSSAPIEDAALDRWVRAALAQAG